MVNINKNFFAELAVLFVMIGFSMFFYNHVKNDGVVKPKSDVSEVENGVGLNSECSDILCGERKKVEVEWYDYVNEEMGIKFEYPAKVANQAWFDYNCLNLVGEKFGGVPVVNLKVYDGILNESVFINMAKKYEFNGEVCAEKDLELEDFANLASSDHFRPAWNIVVVDVNEDGIDQFLKDRFGVGCSYLGKKLDVESGLYDIEYGADGTSLDDTNCFISNTRNYIKYSAEYQKLAYWHTGQECQFGFGFDNCFDDRIVNSFRFVGIEKNDEENWVSCKNESLGVQLKYPEEWKNCEVVNDGFRFVTAVEPYETIVDVLGFKNFREDVRNFNEVGCSYKEVNGDGFVYSGCASRIAGRDMYGVELLDGFYSFFVDFESDQPVPGDLDYIWVADRNSTDNQLRKIMKSVEGI